MSENIKQKIVSFLDTNKIGTLATIVDKKPFTRYMMFHHEELILYTATNEHSHKVENILTQPYVHILLGFPGDELSKPYIEVAAKAEIEHSQTLKEKIWNECLKHWIDSPDDPEYLLLKLVPSSYLFYEKTGEGPIELLID
ncbi:pyridoxamine 5'-phosphate oxidase family protein [Bacillus spongiae]|uniref:Pyridoxamine 5'-phosphate oxidase family protein n=1 Tax=Bacillus spongiae TaxID=2683610 RepID=A0ABU8HHI5_9BACI